MLPTNRSLSYYEKVSGISAEQSRPVQYYFSSKTYQFILGLQRDAKFSIVLMAASNLLIDQLCTCSLQTYNSLFCLSSTHAAHYIFDIIIATQIFKRFQNTLDHSYEIYELSLQCSVQCKLDYFQPALMFRGHHRLHTCRNILNKPRSEFSTFEHQILLKVFTQSTFNDIYFSFIIMLIVMHFFIFIIKNASNDENECHFLPFSNIA